MLLIKIDVRNKFVFSSNLVYLFTYQVGSQDFGVEKDKGPGVGQPKHNTFVGEVCLSAGAYVSRRMINEVRFKDRNISSNRIQPTSKYSQDR